jgi:hypothetical protein
MPNLRSKGVCAICGAEGLGCSMCHSICCCQLPFRPVSFSQVKTHKTRHTEAMAYYICSPVQPLSNKWV